MRPHLAIFRARWGVLLTYRTAALAGFVTQLFWGWIRIMIFDAFYREAPPGAVPMTFEQVRSYVWVSQATITILALNVEGELAEMVRSGGVAHELLKPVGLFGNWFARAMAQRTAPMVMRAVPLLAIAVGWGELTFPPGALPLALWAASLGAAIVLSAALTTVISVALLWNLAGEGVWWIVVSLVWALTGLGVPLPLFPEWMQPVFGLLPFRAMMDVPCRIWTGHIPPGAATAEIAGQLAWAAAFVMLGRAVAARGARRLVLQGG